MSACGKGDVMKTLKKTIKTFNKKALVTGKTYYIKVRPVRTAPNAYNVKKTYIGIQSLKRTCKIK